MGRNRAGGGRLCPPLSSSALRFPLSLPMAVSLRLSVSLLFPSLSVSLHLSPSVSFPLSLSPSLLSRRSRRLSVAL